MKARENPLTVGKVLECPCKIRTTTSKSVPQLKK